MVFLNVKRRWCDGDLGFFMFSRTAPKSYVKLIISFGSDRRSKRKTEIDSNHSKDMGHGYNETFHALTNNTWMRK